MWQGLLQLWRARPLRGGVVLKSSGALLGQLRFNSSCVLFNDSMFQQFHALGGGTVREGCLSLPPGGPPACALEQLSMCGSAWAEASRGSSRHPLMFAAHTHAHTIGCALLHLQASVTTPTSEHLRRLLGGGGSSGESDYYSATCDGSTALASELSTCADGKFPAVSLNTLHQVSWWGAGCGVGWGGIEEEIWHAMAEQAGVRSRAG